MELQETIDGVTYRVCGSCGGSYDLKEFQSEGHTHLKCNLCRKEREEEKKELRRLDRAKETLKKLFDVTIKGHDHVEIMHAFAEITANVGGFKKACERIAEQIIAAGEGEKRKGSKTAIDAWRFWYSMGEKASAFNNQAKDFRSMTSAELEPLLDSVIMGAMDPDSIAALAQSKGLKLVPVDEHAA